MSESQTETVVHGTLRTLRGNLPRLAKVLSEIEEADKKGKKCRHIVEQWKRENFEAIDVLQKTNGPFIEVAGPTLQGFEIIDVKKLKKRIYVSNLTPGLPISDPHTGEALGFVDKTDLIANAEKLPFTDNSLGALFISHFWSDRFLKEATRTLERGGVLVAQGILERQFKSVDNDKFTIQQFTCRQVGRGEKTYDAIFTKI